jgi:hypothetical protein
MKQRIGGGGIAACGRPARYNRNMIIPAEILLQRGIDISPIETFRAGIKLNAMVA